ERTNKRLLTKGTVMDRDTIERISTRNLKRIKFADKDPRVNEQIDEIEEMTSRQIDVLKKIVNEKQEKLQKGDELPPGVIKLIKENSKVEALRRELKALFKDTVLLDAISDLDDDTIESVANTMTRGVFVGSPVFDGARETEIKALLERSGLPTSGKTTLYDGITGEKFEQP